MATALILPNYITTDASGNVTVTGNQTVTGVVRTGNGSASSPSYSFTGFPNTGWYYDTVNSTLAASVAGTETWQLDATGGLNNVGTAVSNMVQMGPSTAAGVRMFRNGSGVVQFGLADASGNATLVATNIQTSNDTGAPQFRASFATTTGIYISNTGPSLYVLANNKIGLIVNSTGQVSNLAAQTATKTAASYSVLAGDSFTVFNNTGAAAQVTYTLPTAAAGLQYTFINTAAGATFTKVLASGTDKIAQAGTLGASAGNLTSTAIWSTVTLVCMATGTWVVTASTGGAYTLT